MCVYIYILMYNIDYKCVYYQRKIYIMDVICIVDNV